MHTIIYHGFRTIMRRITIIWISTAPCGDIRVCFIRLRSAYIYIGISCFIITSTNLIYIWIFSYVVSLLTIYIFSPPLLLICPIWCCNSPIVSWAITLSCPRCINMTAARTFPTLFCFRLSIWTAPSRSCICTCTSSCSCSLIANLNFICSIHIHI